MVQLDPTRGSEIAKTRPCVIASLDTMNATLRTVLIVPMTTTTRGWPWRVPLRFGGKDGELALDQTRAVDKSRLTRRLGQLNKATAQRLGETLVSMFAAGP